MRGRGPGSATPGRLLLLAAVTGARPLTIALVDAWGPGFGAVPVAAQSWIAWAMPANVEGGLALVRLRAARLAGRRLGGRRGHP
jgi:hypothetical protein